MAFGDRAVDPELRVSLMRRAYALAPGEPIWAFKLAEALVRTGRAEEARAIAGDLPATDPTWTGHRGVLVRVDAGEAHFSAAFESAKVLATVDRYGAAQDWLLVSVLLDMGLVMDKVAPLADAFARRFVLADPPRIAPDVSGRRYVPDALRACARTPRGTSRRPASRGCASSRRRRSRSRRSADKADMLGLERLARAICGPPPMRGNRWWRATWTGGSTRWPSTPPGRGPRRARRRAAHRGKGRQLRGRVALARAVGPSRDGPRRSRPREAARAAGRGRLGRRDVPVPAVAEMKALLARLR